ncbi:MAG: four helix bundle protein [Candidatus Saccharibacteria bacterium]|nr:four helix bundle protein [Candidatus Saccharibacteria bacterium]
MGTINNFTDLNTWKEGHLLVIEVLQVVKLFPRNAYALVDQITRSAISITSNIAEGFSRQSKKEKVQFYHIAKGSLTEIHNQILICFDTDLIDSIQFKTLELKIETAGRLLTGLIRSAESKSS